MIDSTLTHAAPQTRRLPSLRKPFGALRSYLHDAQTKRVLRRLPDRLRRDVGLTRQDASMQSNGDSRDVATRLEIEDLRRRLF
ncbi:MAG: DUF1127 domain-containing protein [Pseudomonadota bacterium]